MQNLGGQLLSASSGDLEPDERELSAPTAGSNHDTLVQFYHRQIAMAKLTSLKQELTNRKSRGSNKGTDSPQKILI